MATSNNLSRQASRYTEGAIVREYATLADVYDRRWSRYVEATARATLARLQIAPGDRVLDVGCGTGTLLASIARTCPSAELWGIDLTNEMLTNEMLNVARKRVPQNVHLCAGAADRLPWDNDRFDAVVSCSMLHCVPDPIAALAEANRILRPGGRFVITDWCGDFPSCRMIDRCLRLANRPLGQT